MSFKSSINWIPRPLLQIYCTVIGQFCITSRYYSKFTTHTKQTGDFDFHSFIHWFEFLWNTALSFEDLSIFWGLFKGQEAYSTKFHTKKVYLWVTYLPSQKVFFKYTQGLVQEIAEMRTENMWSVLMKSIIVISAIGIGSANQLKRLQVNILYFFWL